MILVKAWKHVQDSKLNIYYFIVKTSILQSPQYEIRSKCQILFQVLQDLMVRYIKSIGLNMKNMAELDNRTQPDLYDAFRALVDMNISLEELSEYVEQFDSKALITDPVPMFPQPSETRLNHLKPGSQEVLRRPVHVHQHLPPMYPEMEVPDEPIMKPSLHEDNASVIKKEANEPAGMDIDELNKLGMFFSQLDGADDEDEHETSTTNEPSAGSETNPQEQTASGGDDPTPASANADQDESEENMKTDVKQEPRSDNMPELDDDSEQKPSKDATSASTSNVKNEPKDPLAQAMDELTGGGGKNDDDADKSNDDMDGASALAALASAAASTAENSSENGKSTKEKSSSSNGTSSSKDPQEAKRDANWFDVGIIKGSSCTVSSYYLPSGDGERPEIDVEGMHIYTLIWFSIYLLLFI